MAYLCIDIPVHDMSVYHISVYMYVQDISLYGISVYDIPVFFLLPVFLFLCVLPSFLPVCSLGRRRWSNNENPILGYGELTEKEGEASREDSDGFLI